MKKENICFFIGHKDIPDSISPDLRAVEGHIGQFGATEFIVRHYGNFDFMAARWGDGGENTASGRSKKFI